MAAFATPAAAWRRVTPAGETPTREVGLLRGFDGVLHLAWVHQASWYEHLLPGLTLKAERLPGGQTGTVRVRFTVLDAGAPAQAIITASGHSAQTDQQGRLTLSFPAGRRHSVKVTASRTGYAAATKSVVVGR